MPTLKEDLAGDFAEIILNEDEFAEGVTHYPRGDLTAGVERVAKVEQHEETGQATGSYSPPAETDTPDGTKVTRFCKLHLPISVEVVDEERGPFRDAFMVRGELYRAKRITGRTPYRQVVFCERCVSVTTNRTTK